MDRVKLSSLLDQTIDITGILLVIGALFLFVPGAGDPFFFHKQLFVVAGAAALFLLWAVRAVVAKKLVVSVNPLLLPLMLLVAATVASTVATNVSVPKALFARIGLVLSALLVFVVFSSRPSRFLKRMQRTLVWTAIVLAGWSIASFTGLTASLIGTSLVSDKAFTPVGSTLMLLVTLLTALPLLVSSIAKRSTSTAPGDSAESTASAKTSDALRALMGIVGVILTLAASIVAVITLYPSFFGNVRAFLPLSYGWQIAIEVLKERMLFGAGPSRYLSAFTQYRPVAMNASPWWSQRFLFAPNELLQVFTETGMVGLLALLFVIWAIIRLIRASSRWTAGSTALVVILLSLLISPLGVVTLLLLVVYASLVAIENRKSGGASWNARVDIVTLREGMVKVEPSDVDRASSASSQTKAPESVFAWIIGIVALLLGAGTAVSVTRAWQAELAFSDALAAIITNDGTGAYNALQRTISKNPWFDNYHRQYADVNLRLANSLGSRPNLSDQDRTNVAQLAQQAVREARIAVQIDPSDVRNWESLAGTYRALIPVAQGARDFTLLSFSEAVRRDPTNPILRLALGGIFYSSRDFDGAIRNFQTAVSLKSDYANGWYNLALAYEQANRPAEAVRAIQTTLQNVEASSADYQIAQQKLNDLVAKSQASTQSTPEIGGEGTPQEERLSAPEPLPTAAPGANRVQLGEEEAPPVTPAAGGAPTGRVTSSPTPRP